MAKAVEQTIKHLAFDELAFLDEINGTLAGAIAIVGCAADAASHRDDDGMAVTIQTAQTMIINAKGLLEEWDRRSRRPRALTENARSDVERRALPIDPMSLETIQRLEVIIARDKRLNKAAGKANLQSARKR